MKSHLVELSESAENALLNLELEGRNPVIVTEGRLLRESSGSKTLRPESIAAIAQLRKAGIARPSS
jgi:hypothetical protein